MKSKYNAVSSVIGIILMVEITIAIAAVAYIYFGGMMETGQQATPGVVIRAESSSDGEYAEFTVISTTSHEIYWNDVRGILENKTDGYKIDLDDESWKLTGLITAGTLFRLRNDLDITNPSDNFRRGVRYSFTLVYEPANALMGSCNWVH